jgi:hypothetical protein
MMFKFPSIDGQSLWRMDIDHTAITPAEGQLAILRKALNRIDPHRNPLTKTFVSGLTAGIEAYIEMLKKGVPCEEYIEDDSTWVL